MEKIDKKILDYINLKKTVTTLQLCDEFQISESSCRRALRKLDDKRLIARYFGGANSIEKIQNSTDVVIRFNQYDIQKDRIAKRSVESILPGSTIILLGGTTVFRICKYIKRLKITVITNSMLIFNELCECQDITLILLGGQYNRSEAELIGLLTISNSKIFICDYMFMGTNGYITNLGFTTDDIKAVELYSWCMTVANKTYVVVDSSKFHSRGKYIIAPIKEVSSVITDSGISKNIEQELIKNNIEVLIT